MTSKEDKETVQSILTGLEKVVEDIPLTKFSLNAKKQLKKAILEYFDQLYHLSGYTLKQQGVQQVSDSDVIAAARFLSRRSKQSWKMEICYLSGPVLIGFSFTEIMHIIANFFAEPPTPPSFIDFIVVIITLVSGLVLIGYYLKNR